MVIFLLSFVKGVQIRGGESKSAGTPDDIPARGGADSTSVGVLFFPPHGSHHW